MADIISRIHRTYQRQGAMAVVAKSYAHARYLIFPRQGVSYQVKVSSSFEQRWKMVVSVIPTESSNILDLGSNLGEFTSRAASNGFWALGIERDKKLVTVSKKNNTEGRCYFICDTIDIDLCKILPSFDVTLILSVHHNWHSAFGPEIANKMLRHVVRSSKFVVIFEGPSRVSRYERWMPDFKDNDERSVTEYYSNFLSETVGDLISSIDLLGKAPCVGEREPYRWMYALKK